jgi:hypothetical protein
MGEAEEEQARKKRKSPENIHSLRNGSSHSRRPDIYITDVAGWLERRERKPFYVQ